MKRYRLITESGDVLIFEDFYEVIEWMLAALGEEL